MAPPLDFSLDPPGPPRERRLRDRHGRGPRGPAVLAGPHGHPRRTTSRDRFDSLVLDVITDIESRWERHLGLVEYAVEDTPQLPDDWDSGTVPLSSLVRGFGGQPTRLVVFRRPIEHRSESRSDLEAMVLTVVVEQVAELLGIDPEAVDPRVGGHE
ncbi:metallopeptidase family protein [Nocardioides sp.]|uniref:metallopeptidase family protein n=1 Tax=Nocardioides sp. TaxID=35761 RepID=UPI002B274623|nr:metallopeptidase family protein [Nocardioides sp.]